MRLVTTLEPITIDKLVSQNLPFQIVELVPLRRGDAQAVSAMGAGSAAGGGG
jgi:hypothetical protein